MPVETAATPRVSVVMALHNAESFIREAVLSILAQTYRDFELIIVDDASTDRSFAALGCFSDARMRVIRNSTNAGAAASRNEALAVARGEFIAIMDADDVCAPERFERQVAFLDAKPRVGIVGCGIYDNIDARGAVLYTSYLPQYNDTIQTTLLDRWCFLHPSIMFRRTLYEIVGGYRAAFEPAEDHDFILRLLEHCEAHNIPERLVSYRLNPRGLSVAGHRYINELGAAAMRLARQRRSGAPEQINAELTGIIEFKRRLNASRGLARAVQSWRNSLYAANRYYGFGCRELCAGRLGSARRCYLSSLRTNALFLKSCIGLVLSLMPFAASRMRNLFRSSMRECEHVVENC